MIDNAACREQFSFMCNQYKLDLTGGEVGKLAKALADVGNAGPGKVFPKYQGMVVRNDEAGRVVNSMTWAFPRVMKGKNGQPLKPKPVNNARSEKLNTAFWKGAAINTAQRCLIPVTAFAEAVGDYGSMTTTWLSLPDEPTFFCAGLWRDSLEWGRCYTMVMCDAKIELEDIHDRMPVILNVHDHETWLSAPLDEVIELCVPWKGEMVVEHTDIKWGRT